MSGTQVLQSIVSEFGLDRLRAEDLHRAISNAIEKVALRQQRIKAERDETPPTKDSNSAVSKALISSI